MPSLCLPVDRGVAFRGFEARIVTFTHSLYRPGALSHNAVEVWIDELNKWVFLDPTFDTLALVDGRPASAVELQEAALGRQLNRVTFDRGGPAVEPDPTAQVYAIYCRHMFVALSNALFDGYRIGLFGPKRMRFMHYSPRANYPVLRKQLLLGISGGGLLLSLVFWAWTLASLFGD